MLCEVPESLPVGACNVHKISESVQSVRFSSRIPEKIVGPPPLKRLPGDVFSVLRGENQGAHGSKSYASLFLTGC